ncbi:MAG: histidine triad nucleotide-binding protein [Dehalococcoidales bacterium]|nr:MAG: histidine triad nucleotide-binding protein [Dehalococcoidales bacterium]
MDCVFCQIIAGEIPTDIHYRDEEVIAFADINPVAPTHLLIIPRQHIPSLAHLPDDETPLIGHMVKIANQLARDEGISESGYRLVISSGQQGGQLIPHLHLHLIGGRQIEATLG